MRHNDESPTPTTRQHRGYHSAMVGVAVTGATMIITGPDLQAIGAFIVPLGLYLIMFAMISEITFLVSHGVTRLCRRFINRRNIADAV